MSHSHPGSSPTDDVLSGYVSGPDAATEPTARALERVADAHSVIVVEGASDQIAVETLAARTGRSLDGVVVLPVGGAHAFARHLSRLEPFELELRILCDVAEVDVLLHGLSQLKGESGPPYFVCHRDLEDELIRANGQPLIEEVLAASGDLRSFSRMQRQPEWRSRDFEAQFHRFLGSGARRKLRYAKLLTESLDLGRAPPPMLELFDSL